MLVPGPARDALLAGLQAPSAPAPQRAAPAALSPASFVGNWNIDVRDMLQSKMRISFLANGQCHGTQQASFVGTVQFQGSWYFDPASRTLAVQAAIGFVPTQFAIMITGETPGGLQGVDDKGIGYVFQRA
jgi:hypothetical protein